MASEDFKVVRDQYTFFPKDDINHGILIQALEIGAELKVHYIKLKRLAFNQEGSYAEISKKEV